MMQDIRGLLRHPRRDVLAWTRRRLTERVRAPLARHYNQGVLTFAWGSLDRSRGVPPWTPRLRGTVGYR